MQNVEIQEPLSEKEMAQAQLPDWKCHKVVRAAEIVGIHYPGDGTTSLILMGVPDALPVGEAYMEKHNPDMGDYYVLYEDGYESASPPEAFENGYTQLGTVSIAMLEEIAGQCHEMNRQYCEALGDTSQPLWDKAPQWQRESAINGVMFALQSIDSTPEDSHNNWMSHKAADGWVYGEVKDPDKKEHPCMVPYSQLPASQRFKDVLFRTIVELNLKPLGIG